MSGWIIFWIVFAIAVNFRDIMRYLKIRTM